MIRNTRSLGVNDRGSQGPGIPGVHSLLLHGPAVVVNLLRRGQVAAAKHKAIALLADLWNFYLKRSHSQTVECPCCGWQGPGFLATSNWRAVTFQSRCPCCDSRSRHRGLMKVLPEVLSKKPEGPILFFAPEHVLMQQLPQITQEQILTTDLYRADVDFPGEDIQSLSFPSDSFSLILCNHVLEHVPDDQQALFECARVLKPDGIAVFTVPGDFNRYETRQFLEIDDSGHYRHYGMDILEKMQVAFQEACCIDMGERIPERWCVRKGDYAFLCSKRW